MDELPLDVGNSNVNRNFSFYQLVFPSYYSPGWEVYMLLSLMAFVSVVMPVLHCLILIILAIVPLSNKITFQLFAFAEV